MNRSLIATIVFGFLMTLSSGLGQTFFISLFNPELRQTFSLSHGDIGGLYFAGTLLSAATVVWLGKLIDQINLRLYTACVTFGLTVACLTMARVESTVSLVVAFFLLRLFGQGLSGHTGVTTVSRVSREFRGRALSIVGLGFSVAEIVLPLATLLLVSRFGWRQTWNMYATLELVLVALLAQLLLSFASTDKKSGKQEIHDPGSWTRAQVIRDKRFWKIAPAVFSPPVISTALFFHQQSLAESRFFTLTYWASGIAAYSIAAVLASLTTGMLVDRYSGAKIVRYYLLPMILAVLVAAFMQTSMLPFVYYALIGMTVGIGTPSVSALWLELYGTEHIGAIRAMTHACMVFGTALGPAVFGYLLDTGVTWSTLLTSSALWMLLASLFLFHPNLKMSRIQTKTNEAAAHYSD